ncbi:MAG: hypothetical protein ACRC0F_10530 [Cetobacterium sp.]
MIKLGIHIDVKVKISYIKRGKIYTLDIGEVDKNLKIKLLETKKILEKNLKEFKFESYLVLNNNLNKESDYTIRKIFNFSGINLKKIIDQKEIKKEETLTYSEWAILKYESENGLKSN